VQELLKKDNVSSGDLEKLLKAREDGNVDFLLVDVRENMEYDAGHVKGVDMLKPTSTFQEWVEKFFNENLDKTIIFTCRTGARSGQVQNVFRSNGHKKVINHMGGIVSYGGEVER
jgi:rhodanese-related sulfurtransferase